ncbi:MAG: hypothetical protein H9536_11190 [Aphanizomenon flos-aquae Clear-A1]|nr:hypothetical protein [Aphanizomenon flos-aquae Clear-A1]
MEMSFLTTNAPYIQAINDAKIKEVTKENYIFNLKRLDGILKQRISTYIQTPDETFNKIEDRIRDDKGDVNIDSLKLLVATIMAVLKHSKIRQL